MEHAGAADKGGGSVNCILTPFRAMLAARESSEAIQKLFDSDDKPSRSKTLLASTPAPRLGRWRALLVGSTGAGRAR